MCSHTHDYHLLLTHIKYRMILILVIYYTINGVITRLILLNLKCFSTIIQYISYADQNIMYRLQTTHTTCLFHGTIKNGIRGCHILSNELILCQNSLATKPHWKFVSEPWKKLYGNQSQSAFYPNCTNLVQFLLPWTLLCHNIDHVALV